ncbi:MAG: hypothetical protein OD817_01030 [Gammaproteobacteria bacterium]
MLILALIAAYLLPGAAFGLAFFWRGHAVIAPEARGASLAVRLLWTPAAVALWPLLCVKWWRRRNRND